MKPVFRICAVVALNLTFTLCALAGTIHSPGAVDPPPPQPEQTASSTNITTTVILEILSLIS